MSSNLPYEFESALADILQVPWLIRAPPSSAQWTYGLTVHGACFDFRTDVRLAFKSYAATGSDLDGAYGNDPKLGAARAAALIGTLDSN